ncbi:Nascent polypeptide-associated complex subunit beta [Brettanomyces nanus]|uniref:Nascent polypeptide-associated complex subunit beta n=1 Tax=Eeniella nana TaxID=13502 RepID=A0A875RYW8_EENNA|nr:Nascent polypeptide-associated complex subunit beta [Brettanomyces nanus]QPG72869.1 Nascent polypeptide-associated complex subunit beta [Brettanomyces nanus]
MPVDPAKLAKLKKQSAKRVGGSRVKAKKVQKNPEGDDTKLQNALKKLNAQVLNDVEEANFFKEDGNVLHFNKVGVQAAPIYNTYAFSGFAQEKSVTELIPGILPQLGAENLSMLQKIAQQLQDRQAAAGNKEEEKDEDIPELVEGETFDKADID